MRTVTRTEVRKIDKYYREMLKTEKHHKHEIIETSNGTLRWKEDPDVIKILEKISLNDLVPLLCFLGYDKNSEPYRQLYRDIGYSLFGYWEVFYWEVNNEYHSEYVPNADCIGKK